MKSSKLGLLFSLSHEIFIYSFKYVFPSKTLFIHLSIYFFISVPLNINVNLQILLNIYVYTELQQLTAMLNCSLFTAGIADNCSNRGNLPRQTIIIVTKRQQFTVTAMLSCRGSYARHMYVKQPQPQQQQAITQLLLKANLCT